MLRQATIVASLAEVQALANAETQPSCPWDKANELAVPPACKDEVHRHACAASTELMMHRITSSSHCPDPKTIPDHHSKALSCSKI